MTFQAVEETLLLFSSRKAMEDRHVLLFGVKSTMKEWLVINYTIYCTTSSSCLLQLT